MIEKKQKEIDGVTFEFMPLMATPARDMLVQLCNKLGPSLASGIEGLDKAKSFSLESNVAELIPALAGSLGGTIRSFCTSLQPGFYKNLITLFLSRVTFQNENGGMQKLDEAAREIMFAVKLMTEMKVLIWCLEVQYADFFGLLRKGGTYAMLNLAEKSQSGLNSQKDSIGVSSESPATINTPVL